MTLRSQTIVKAHRINLNLSRIRILWIFNNSLPELELQELSIVIRHQNIHTNETYTQMEYKMNKILLNCVRRENHRIGRICESCNE